ncbi:hypothetical protein LENED_000867 [Lentinula edodes]|uniref:Uncharacterized protein n=1 Tax=Lentinula edodes TaxID=5353 RepID=A0A1Q3DWM9_LENED|nr:hypothetical protein LENED_000867 [Lentinula edodes]
MLLTFRKSSLDLESLKLLLEKNCLSLSSSKSGTAAIPSLCLLERSSAYREKRSSSFCGKVLAIILDALVNHESPMKYSPNYLQGQWL